jgi:hypothetical protein
MPGIPPRPDLDAGGRPIGTGVPVKARSGRTRVLAIVTAIAVMAAGLSVVLVPDGERCDGAGPAESGPEVGVRWIVDHRYCFRVTSRVGGVVTAEGTEERHVAEAVERITLLVRSVGADGTMTATMQVIDESHTIDGGPGMLRPPMEFTVSLDRMGGVHSPFGWGVPTGISDGSGLPSPGQFVPLLEPRTMEPGDRWTETLTIPLPGTDPLTGTFEGSFVGPATVHGTDSVRLDASFAMAESVHELSVDELETQQGSESGLPAGAVYEFTTGASTLEEEILLDAGSHELLRATISSGGVNGFRVTGLPEGDPRGEPTGFDGTMSLTIDRIF